MGEQPVDRHAVGSRRAAWRVIASVEQPEKVIDVPVAAQHQAPTVQAVEKTVEVRQVQFLDRVADIPVSMQRQMLQKQVSELISEWFNAVKGVSDSEDLPLNVYREPLLQNKILRVIKKSRVTKYRDMLAEIAELEDYYNKLYEQSGMYLKHGIHEDSAVGVKSAEVLRVNTYKSEDEQFCLDEYVDRMKEGENDIYCITGESIAVVSSRKKGHEVLSVADPVDECAVHQPKELHGTKPKPTTNEGLELGDQDEKKEHEELKAEFEPLMNLTKDVPDDKVEMVIMSDRIVDSPCVLTTTEHGWSANTRWIMNAQARRDNSMTSDRVSKKTMEVNPTHPIMTELETRTSTDKSDKTVKASISLLTSGFNLDGPTQFAGRVHRGIEHGLRTQQRDSSQAVASNKQQQPQVARQPTRQERGKEWGERKKERKGERERGRSEREERESVKKGHRGRGQEGRKEEEESEAEEGRGEQVKEDVTGWTEVTRKRRRKMVQIFVKVDGYRVIPMEVSPADDKVEDVMKRIQKDEDVYVTMQGKVLRMSDVLKSCGVTDGCTVEVTSRLRGGGKRKDKKGHKERKRAVKPKGPEQKSEEEPKSDEGPALIQMDEVLRRIEGNEEFQKIIDWVSEGSEGEVQQKVQSYLATIRMSWMSKEQFEYLESGVWRAIDARRKERRERHNQRREEQEQRRQEEQEQEPEQEQGKKVRFGGEEEPLEETRAESTDEPEVTGRLVEVRTGRGSAGLVRGGDACRTDESSRKGKGKGNGGKGEHGSKGGVGSKGTQQVENLAMDEDEEADEENERGRVAPNMGAGGSHPQATSDLGRKEEEKNEARVLSWADCNDEEVEENQKEVEQEKETRQWETTEERPPGLEEEEMESEPKTQQEEKPSQVQSEQEAQEEERRVGEARELKRAQEAQEEERREQEAREKETKAQEARERRKAQEAREEERKAQEAREVEEKKAQEAREEQRRAQEAREEQRRAQEAREEQRRAQEAREEQRKAQEAREEQKRAQEAREEQKRAQEAQEDKRAQEERERLAREAKAQEEREREGGAHEERTEQDREAEAQGGHESDVKAQEGHDGEVKAQEGQGEDANSMHEECHVSNRHMTWWQNAWWVRVDNGPHMRSARGRRRTWRAARQAAEQVRIGNWVGETRGEERENWEQGRRGRKESNTLHLVIHLPTTSTPTTPTAAAAMRLQ